jgi:hypothetical protein
MYEIKKEKSLGRDLNLDLVSLRDKVNQKN